MAAAGMSERDSSVLFGLDIGTTACKLVAFDAAGTALAQAREEYPLEHPHKGWAELDPDIIFDAARTVISRVALRVRDYSSVALAISSQGEAFVPVDIRGQWLMRAPVTVDTRGKEAAARFRHAFGDEDIAGITGHRLTHWSTLSKLLWMKQSADDHLRRTWRVFSVGDYVLHRFGLEPRMDLSLAARTVMLDVNELTWSTRLLERAGIDMSVLPPLAPAGTPIGTIEGGLPELGLHVPMTAVAGGHDQACAALGAGVITAGTGLYSLGTTESLAIATAGPQQALPMANLPNYPHVVPGSFIAIAGTQNGGRLLRWYDDLVRASGAAETLAEVADRPSPAIVIPHFAGTNTVLDDDLALGVIAGLSLDSDRPAITHALLEGITSDQRIALAEIRRCGLPVERLNAVGGATRSTRWMQIKADMLDVPIQTLEESEASCAGAAMLAGLGSGALPTVDAAVASFVRVSTVYEPRRDHAAVYERKMAIYRSVYRRLRSIWPRLNELENEIMALDASTRPEGTEVADSDQEGP